MLAMYNGRWLADPKVVAYLTITEGLVPVGQAQRRPGLHIERPGLVHGGTTVAPGAAGYKELAAALAWGMGDWDVVEQIPVDGIIMVSNVAGTSAVWPRLIVAPEEVCDEHGGIEPLRHRLGPPRLLGAGELCWLTDRTPHECLPVPAPAPASDPAPAPASAQQAAIVVVDGVPCVHRQFARLVLGPISVWHSRHNTPNPDGLAPAAPVSDVDKWGATPP
jgi:hypothetical protein